MKKRMTDNFAVRLLGTLLLSSPFTLLMTRLHCIKFSIVQQVFKIEYLQSIFTNAEQRKLKLLLPEKSIQESYYENPNKANFMLFKPVNNTIIKAADGKD